MTVKEKFHRIQRATNAVAIAQDRLDDLNSAFVRDYIKPILRAMHGNGEMYIGYVVKMEERRDTFKIETTSESRGNVYHHDYTIPLSILYADKPMEAAAAHKAARDEEAKQAARVRAIMEIERLQKSLVEDGIGLG